MQEGRYDEAISAFAELGEYKDSDLRIRQARANKAFAAGEYDAAGDIYALLPDEYRDRADDYKALYDAAKAQMDAGNFDAAIAGFNLAHTRYA